MIPLKKLTPLAVGYRVTSRRPPKPELVVILRGKFRLEPHKRLELVRAELERFGDRDELDENARRELENAAYMVGQGSLTADKFDEEDEGRQGQLVYPGDFAEWKPKADVMVRATCHPRTGVAEEATVGFGVGKLYKELKVYGARAWVDKILGGKHTDPLAFRKLPVDYRNAFGGRGFGANPVGLGFETERLPCVEDPRSTITRSGATPRPAGFGPLSPEWDLRKGKLGKDYGEEYEKTRAPWYSVDYDWSHQNAAPEDQQIEGYLRGDEPLRFVNLHPNASDFTVDLPGIRPRAFVMLEEHGMKGGVEVPLVLDTVYADLEDGFLYVTWRGLTAIRTDDMTDVKYMLAVHEELHGERKPEAFYLSALQEFADDPFGLKQNPAAELAELEKKLDSGELDKELDALGPDEDAVSKIFAPLAAKSPGGAQHMKSMREGVAQMMAKAGGSKEALKQALKQGIAGAFSGGGGPRIAFTPKGEPVTKPLVRRMMRDIAQASKKAGNGTDLADIQKMTQKELSKLKLPGVDPKDLELPESVEAPAPAPGADFSGCDLAGLDWGGLDLSGAVFDGAVLRGVNLKGANLSGASFLGATLTVCFLNEADLGGANLTQTFFMKCVMQKAKLDGATIEMSNFRKCDLGQASFKGAKGKSTTFEVCGFEAAKLAEAELLKCIFGECSFEGAHGVGAKLMRSFFRECDLRGALLAGADVSNGGFFGSNLTGADFHKATLDGANFQGSTLDDTSFRSAAMDASIFMSAPAKGADFTAANLPRARFYRAALNEATFDEANLMHVDMRKAALEKASFKNASCFQGAFQESAGNVDFRGANLHQAQMNRNRLVVKK